MKEIAIQPGLQMILAGANHITTLSLPRENGQLYIEIGKDRLATPETAQQPIDDPHFRFAPL
ncbi:hypothetical protein HMPREF3107_06840 [Neisseria sp. HMSC31F04]|uniref:hypothetical protein n=1 Tax=Neisseria sp. HMSC31F04 TaxID=1581075 RepID=UPI0008A5B0CF|nr:hypothetical protein [Neisseria sp. HMSC31F04]OFT01066.1 hypothetical protein HMPREF3107_06840 [Neisseria sp. HMSC31F04]